MPSCAVPPSTACGRSAGRRGSVSSGYSCAPIRRSTCGARRVACHAIGGAGGKLGPDFTSLGASAPIDYIVESVLDPTAKVKEGYHAFAFTMNDGAQAIGVPSRETAAEQFIRPGPGPEVALAK